MTRKPEEEPRPNIVRKVPPGTEYLSGKPGPRMEFAPTHPDLKRLEDQQEGAAGRYVRIRIPAHKEYVPEIVERMLDAAFGS